MNLLKFILVVLVGAILGVCVVRSFMLDPIEEIAWRLFWHDLSEGNVQARDMKTVWESATFRKSAMGFFVGGFVASLFAFKRKSKSKF